MADNRIYLRCNCGKGGVAIGKYYCGSPWFIGRPTPRGKFEGEDITDEARCKEYVDRIDEFFKEHSHEQNSDMGGRNFILQYEDEF